VTRTPLLAAIAFALAGLLVSGCAAAGPEWVDQGTAYSTEDAKEVFGRIAESNEAGSPVSEASDLRHAALVGLRRRGGGAAEAADLITKTFPSTAGVPIYVERSSFNGEDALLLVELIGPEGGSLDDVRLWVISTEGDVLFSAVK